MVRRVTSNDGKSKNSAVNASINSRKEILGSIPSGRMVFLFFNFFFALFCFNAELGSTKLL